MLEKSRKSVYSVSRRRAQDVYVVGGGSESGHSTTNLLAVLWRRKWIVLACVVIAIAGGLVYFKNAKPIYASSSTVYVQDNALKTVADPAGGLGRSAGYLMTQCQLLTSTAMCNDALKRADVANTSLVRGTDSPAELLKNIVTAQPDKQSDLIYVAAEAENPQEAAVIVNALVDTYISYQTSQHRSTAVEVLKTYQKEIDEHEAKLKAVQKSMLDLKKENPDLVLQTDKGSLVVNRMSDLAERLLRAQQQATDLKTAASQVDRVKDNPSALKWLMAQFQIDMSADSGLDPALMAEYRQSASHLHELMDSGLGASHDLIKQAETKHERLQAELDKASREAAANYITLLQQALSIAETRVDELQSALDEARHTAINLTFKQAEYVQFQQDAERITRTIDLLDNRVKEINVNEDAGSLIVSVLEKAKPSFVPVRPLQPKVLGMATVIGLLAGVGLALLRDLTDQRIRSGEEVSTLLDVPLLGVVPHVGNVKTLQARGRLVHMQPRSVVAEAYRGLRTGIFFGMANGSAKTVLITSPTAGEGKSMFASNLAIAFAQSGRRTLLIDADCRRPTQAKIHNLKAGIGVADILAGKATLEEGVRKSEIADLDLLPCGTIPGNPAELLDSQALLNLLATAGEQYELVVIDSPPVMPVTDARILAASCDATVMVVRAGRATRRMVAHARDALNSVTANLVGVVVNDVASAKGHQYSYYGTSDYGMEDKSSDKLLPSGEPNGKSRSGQTTANGR